MWMHWHLIPQVFKAWLDRKTKEKRQRLKKENEARWKANKFTGREFWNRSGVTVQDDEDAVEGDAYEHSSNPPTDDEGEEDEGSNGTNESQ